MNHKETLAKFMYKRSHTTFLYFIVTGILAGLLFSGVFNVVSVTVVAWICAVISGLSMITSFSWFTQATKLEKE